MKNISTFSIIARDPATGEIGVAVQSKFLAVGSIVPWAKAGVGAIATQAVANVHFGELGLELLKKGYSANEVLNSLLSLDKEKEDRQIGIVDFKGNSAAYTGKKCLSWAGHITGNNFSCQGNILENEKTLKALSEIFKNSKGSLAQRLVNALNKANEAGGDKRGRLSAALLVVKPNGSYGEYNDRYIDLRVDDDPEPTKKLSSLLDSYKLYSSKSRPEDLINIEEHLTEKV